MMEQLEGLTLFESKLVRACWAESCAGYRELDENETRISHSPHCSFQLVFDAFYPEDPPDPDKPVYYKDGSGVITIKNQKATVGTWLHEGLQKNLVKLNFVDKTEKKINLDAMAIKLTGHIDISIDPGKLADIKTVGIFVFPAIAGQKPLPSTRTYTTEKREASIIQANTYAYIEACDHFLIIWMNRDTGELKIDVFETNADMFKHVIDKLESVKYVLRNHTLPLFKYLIKHFEFTGICFCDLGKKRDSYCRHHQNGTTGDFPEKSGANCPGYDKILDLQKQKTLLDDFSEQVSTVEEIVEKYTYMLDETWYCSLCHKKIQSVTDFKTGFLTPHHLWFDHEIREFDPQDIKAGKKITR